MPWVIEDFGEDDALTGRVDLDDALRELFRAALGLPPQEELVDSYRLPPAVAQRISDLLNLGLTPATKEYYLQLES